MGKPGDYGCLICGNDHFNRYEVLKHLILEHSNMDVIVRYGCKPATLANKYTYDRIRSGIFQKIMFNTFDKELERILSTTLEFKLHELSYIFPLGSDLDAVNKKQREIVYQKKIDILLKLSTLKTFSVKEAVEEERDETGIKGYHATTWDLKKDFDAESKPD